jgi:hypothetical protein
MTGRTPGPKSQRSGLSGEVWPIHLKPLASELLSSWLARLVRAYGTSAHEFERTALPGTEVWVHDVDVDPNGRLLEIMTKRTATSPRRVENATLRGYSRNMSTSRAGASTSEWILPLGPIRQLHRRPGVQFCPECLEGDPYPFFRREWRLAFVTVCERHERLMLDRCPWCRAAVNYHRIPYTAGPMTLCYRCGSDLRCARGAALDEIGRLVLARQRALLIGATTGRMTVHESKDVVVSAWRYYRILRQLFVVLHGRRPGAKRLQDLVVGRMGLVRTRLCGPKQRELSRLEVQERHVTLALADWLLSDWPSRLIAACRETACSRREFHVRTVAMKMALGKALPTCSDAMSWSL